MAQAPGPNTPSPAQANWSTLITAIAGNVILLTNVLLFLFGGFFLYLGFTGKPLLFPQPESADVIGRIGSFIVGVGVLLFAGRTTAQSIRTLQSTKSEGTPPAALIAMAKEEAATQTSMAIADAIKRLHATQKEVTVLEVYSWLNNEQIMKNEHYQELVQYLLKSGRDKS